MNSGQYGCSYYIFSCDCVLMEFASNRTGPCYFSFFKCDLYMLLALFRNICLLILGCVFYTSVTYTHMYTVYAINVR